MLTRDASISASNTLKLSSVFVISTQPLLTNVNAWCSSEYYLGLPYYSRVLSKNKQAIANYIHSVNRGLVSRLLQKINTRCNLLQFYSLISATTRHWKVILKKKKNRCIFEGKQISLDKLTCKSIHSMLITVFTSHCRKN